MCRAVHPKSAVMTELETEATMRINGIMYKLLRVETGILNLFLFVMFSYYIVLICFFLVTEQQDTVPPV